REAGEPRVLVGRLAVAVQPLRTVEAADAEAISVRVREEMRARAVDRDHRRLVGDRVRARGAGQRATVPLARATLAARARIALGSCATAAQRIQPGHRSDLTLAPSGGRTPGG